MLAQNYASLLETGWHDAFAQKRTHKRAVEHALSLPMILGRRTISRTICSLDRADQDWSADYKLFSSRSWETEALFDPILKSYIKDCSRGPIAVAFDDTKIARCGKKIVGTSWQRDPMSPPFHVNFVYGLRFIQASLLFPCYRNGGSGARALPVRFDNAPVVKKPGKRSTEEQRQLYRHLKKQRSLSAQTLGVIESLRMQMDVHGAGGRILLAVLDGSFCNRVIFRSDKEMVDLVARCRKDARLCMPETGGGRRKYKAEIFTPEQVRKDDRVPWKRAHIHYASKFRWIRYKVLDNVLWRRGAGVKPLRLIVIAPQPYKLSKHSRTNYREPAYVLTTDLRSSASFLIQKYFDRWQIEVNHRDEKSLLGVGQAQVWSPMSIPRHPAFAVASYSMLLLAAMKTFGTDRTEAFDSLPKWRKKGTRYSTLDLLSLLRKEINSETSVSSFINDNMAKNLVKYAYT